MFCFSQAVSEMNRRLCTAYRSFLFLCVFFCLPLLIPCSASGASSVRKLQKKVGDVQQQIREKQDEVKGVSEKEAEVINTLSDLDQSLNDARKRVAVSRNDLNSIEKKIQKIRARSDVLEKEIRTGEQYAARRMVSLYKLHAIGEVSLLADADSMSEFFQRKNALERILAYDRSVLENLDRRKAELQDTARELAARKAEQQLVADRHQQESRVLAHQQAQRKELLSEIRRKKSLMRAAIAQLKKDAENLEQKIRALEESARRRESSKKVPSGTFPALKSLLNMPVEGKIVSFFGPYKNTEFNVTNIQSGIDIRTKPGAPVHSAGDGQVIYAGWFKGYGNMIIVDHGDHYYTLYAHAEELFKAEGDMVKAREVIASAGPDAIMGGPGLHFEVRHHGKPVDPLKWLKKG